MKFPYKRTIVFGSTGVGKTTLVRHIADEFDLPVIDVDGLRREAGKSTAPEETFFRLTKEGVMGEIWITDGSYTSVQDIVWPRAEAMIWLDFSFGVSLSRLIKRSLYRIFIRKKSEKPVKGRNQPAHERAGNYLQIIFTRRQRRQRYFSTIYSSQNVHLHVIRLSSPEEVQQWLDQIKGHRS